MARRRAKAAHGGARAGAGHPARSEEGAAKTFALRLTVSERSRLKALAAEWRCSESDAVRRALDRVAELESAMERVRSLAVSRRGIAGNYGDDSPAYNVMVSFAEDIDAALRVQR